MVFRVIAPVQTDIPFIGKFLWKRWRGLIIDFRVNIHWRTDCRISSINEVLLIDDDPIRVVETAEGPRELVEVERDKVGTQSAHRLVDRTRE